MIIDSNILIGYLNGDEAIIEALNGWKEDSRVLLISAVSFAEVLSYPKLAEKDIQETKKFLSGFVSIPLDDILAEKAAYFRRIYKLTLTDAAIAGTASVYRVPLITRDKQLQKVKEIFVIEV